MSELAISDVASWLERPHKVRPTVPDKNALRKVVGGRIESHTRFRENRSHERKRNEDFGSPAWVSHQYGPLSSRVGAHSTPLSKSCPTEKQPSPVRNIIGSKDKRSSQHSRSIGPPTQHFPCDEPTCTVISKTPSNHMYVPQDPM